MLPARLMLKDFETIVATTNQEISKYFIWSRKTQPTAVGNGQFEHQLQARTWKSFVIF